MSLTPEQIEGEGALQQAARATAAEPVPVSALRDGIANAVQERGWTRWSERRPPNARGSYRYRAAFDLLGVPVTAEWNEEMHLCGMGYGDSEWWPLSPCRWDGYRRYITIDNLEWSLCADDDPPGVVWHGLNLLPCPFTGKQPTVEASGQFIGAPLWRTEALWLSSPGVPKRRWTNAKAMIASWNTRAPAQGMETRQGGDGTAPSQDDSPVACDAPNPHQGGHNEGTH